MTYPDQQELDRCNVASPEFQRAVQKVSDIEILQVKILQNIFKVPMLPENHIRQQQASQRFAYPICQKCAKTLPNHRTEFMCSVCCLVTYCNANCKSMDKFHKPLCDALPGSLPNDATFKPFKPSIIVKEGDGSSTRYDITHDLVVICTQRIR